VTERYSVLVFEHSHAPDPDASWSIHGFPTLELAVEFARRWTRDSLEENRSIAGGRAETLRSWLSWGENALVYGEAGAILYNARDEVDRFVDNPATPDERDWKAIKKRAGLEE
jgi:hypothetical protein